MIADAVLSGALVVAVIVIAGLGLLLRASQRDYKQLRSQWARAFDESSRLFWILSTIETIAGRSRSDHAKMRSHLDSIERYAGKRFDKPEPE